jgi:hypothetical protein
MVLTLRFALVLTAGLWWTACGSTGPTDPTPLPISPPTLPPTTSSTTTSSTTTRVIKGVVVDENGAAVSGAEVRLGIVGAQGSVVTDAGGAFDMTVESAPSAFSPAFPVVVNKPGYETSLGWAGECCGRVRVYHIRPISAGGTLTLVLFPESYCGRDGDVPCRRVRVTSASKGTLRVQVAPTGFIVVPAETFPAAQDSSTFSVSVEAGSETSLDVWGLERIDSAGASFTFTSTVE